EQAAAGTAARQGVGRAEDLPQGRVEHVGVLRIHHEIDGAGLVVAIEHALPRFAAVLRTEDAAFGVGAVGIAQRRDEHDVRVGRMDADAGNRLRLFEPHRRPRLAGVAGLVDAVALDDIAAQLCLPHAGVYDVWIDRADLD